jgi:hypothetical protein
VSYRTLRCPHQRRPKAVTPLHLRSDRCSSVAAPDDFQRSAKNCQYTVSSAYRWNKLTKARNTFRIHSVLVDHENGAWMTWIAVWFLIATNAFRKEEYLAYHQMCKQTHLQLGPRPILLWAIASAARAGLPPRNIRC